MASQPLDRMCSIRSFVALVLGLFVALLPACGGPLPSIGYPHEKEYDPRKHEYVIGVADELRVEVWKMADLTDDVIVRPDGTITPPLIGEMKATGKTPSRLVQEIRQKLVAYVKDGSQPITVEIRNINSYRFVVAGQVARPGPLAAKYYVTVSEAIIMAGGPTRFAEPERTLILRADGSGKIRRIPVNAKALAEGKNLEQDLAIVSGDTIVVP
jgi:polysaccharide export outer membrane protein